MKVASGGEFEMQNSVVGEREVGVGQGAGMKAFQADKKNGSVVWCGDWKMEDFGGAEKLEKMSKMDEQAKHGKRTCDPMGPDVTQH